MQSDEKLKTKEIVTSLGFQKQVFRESFENICITLLVPGGVRTHPISHIRLHNFLINFYVRLRLDEFYLETLQIMYKAVLFKYHLYFLCNSILYGKKCGWGENSPHPVLDVPPGAIPRALSAPNFCVSQASATVNHRPQPSSLWLGQSFMNLRWIHTSVTSSQFSSRTRRLVELAFQQRRILEHVESEEEGNIIVSDNDSASENEDNVEEIIEEDGEFAVDETCEVEIEDSGDGFCFFGKDDTFWMKKPFIQRKQRATNIKRHPSGVSAEVPTQSNISVIFNVK